VGQEPVVAMASLTHAIPISGWGILPQSLSYPWRWHLAAKPISDELCL